MTLDPPLTTALGQGLAKPINWPNFSLEVKGMRNMHIHPIEDRDGDIVDCAYFCSDYCHRQWCLDETNPPYQGWYGAQEGPTDYSVECEECGETLNDVED